LLQKTYGTITIERGILLCPNCQATVLDDGNKYCWRCGVEIIELTEEVEYEQ
jgi:predicted amidophosphoribosyltransferase